ncbi:MAG: TetR/AcrR family transcriptional regulator [Proteobacteria bacterium]|nr:TetR/AcrR family transcriptional regulator [Pseudomonadota bacterium]
MRATRERSGRREQNKAENRAALLKAARSVFAEIGYGAAGVRDIVRRTDLASGTFYNYFKDKDEIFAAVVAEMTVELLRRHREGRAKARTAEEFFRNHISVYMNFVAEDPEILAFGRQNVTPIRMLMEKPELQGMARQLHDDVGAAIAHGILPDVDIQLLVAALAGVVFEISVVMVSRDPVNPAEAVEFATRLMMGGLGNLPRRHPSS